MTQSPTTPRQLFQLLVEQYDALKYELLDLQSFDAEHFGFPDLYYKIMESDKQRVQAFGRAFEQLDLAEAVVCEVGVGTMVLSRLYLDRVKKAYLIESNPKLIPHIQACIEAGGWSGKVVLLFQDARQVVLPEPVDVIIGELMSIYCANEQQVQIFRHLRQYLQPEGYLLPRRILNFARLCYASFEAEHRHYPINFSRHRPAFLSSQVLMNEIDLYENEHDEVSLRQVLTPCLSGEVNALYLESYIEIAKGINFTGTDSLMPPTVVQLSKPIWVEAGVPVCLEMQFCYGSSLDEFVATLKPLT